MPICDISMKFTTVHLTFQLVAVCVMWHNCNKLFRKASKDVSCFNLGGKNGSLASKSLKHAIKQPF